MANFCKTVGCTNKAQTRGMCRRHYDEERDFERNLDYQMRDWHAEQDSERAPAARASAQTDYDSRKHSVRTAYLLATFGGLLALHKFYLGNPLLALLFIVTLGGALIWWIIDLITLPVQVSRWNQWLAGEVAQHHGVEAGALTL